MYGIRGACGAQEVYGVIWGCSDGTHAWNIYHPFTPISHHTPPTHPLHPYTYTPLLPCFSGAIFGKYPIYIDLVSHFLLDLMKRPQDGGCDSFTLNNM